MSADLLQQLQTAASDDERHWLITRHLLDALPPDLAQMAWAAAVPHWFDAQILAALRPELKDKAEALYADLQRLPFVEPFAGRGHNVHELTRRLLLDNLWREHREEYTALSQQAADYFGSRLAQAQEQITVKLTELSNENADPAWVSEQLQAWLKEHSTLLEFFSPDVAIEHIYHLLIAEPEKGADAARKGGLEWHNAALTNYNFSLVSALTRAVHEHATAGRASARAKGWGLDFEGSVAYYSYRYPEAIAAFEEAIPIFHAIGDKLGEADCINCLGDVHTALSELPQARARYAEALSIRRAIGDKLGEANCIQSLGDVHIRLSELPQARARYEEALPLYRAIGKKFGEANCIQRLGDVHTLLSELPQARARYAEALPIYRAIGDKLGEANCIHGLGKVAAWQNDETLAQELFAQAREKYRQFGDSWSEANVQDNIGVVHRQRRAYPEAIAAFDKAIALFKDESKWWLNRASVYLKLKNAECAAHDIDEAAKLQPDNAYLFLRRGQLALLLGQLDQAMAHFQEALKRYPRMSYAFFGLGLAHLRAARPAEALEAYRQGLAVTDSPAELDDAREDLQELKAAQPGLAGVAEAEGLLAGWRPLTG